MTPSLICVNNKYKLGLPHAKGLIFVPLDDVLYFISDNIYCHLFKTDNSETVILCSIKDLEATLCSDHLFRIHKRYIVNLDKVDSYSKSEGGHVMVGEKRLPVSRSRRLAFISRIKCTKN